MTEETRKAYVYGLLGSDDRICYVGVSGDVAKRAREHWHRRNQKVPLQTNPGFCAWLQTLNSPPRYHVFEEVPWTDRFKAEEHWLSMLHECPSVDLLNVAGGQGIRLDGIGLCAGVPKSDEMRAKLSATRMGMGHTDETRAKLSKARMGKKLTPGHRAKIGASIKGRIESAETRARKSASAKARWARLRQQQETEE